jgi:hypothetical protein
MRRFKSAGPAQHFLNVHAAVQNLFRVGDTSFARTIIDSVGSGLSIAGVRRRSPSEERVLGRWLAPSQLS